MALLFSWGTFFLIIVSAGHGEGNKWPEAPKDFELIRATATCRALYLYTHAGVKRVTCKWDCKHEGPGKTEVHSSKQGDECLTVSSAGFHRMKCEVNYTCKLGLCDQALNCQPSNLLVGCWKLPLISTQPSDVESYGCP
uniref:Evasin n=1 Tax=Rhipicephalus appendiculatus TaxID=34631 RepID=A0A131Z6N2_RHIAP